MPTYRGTWTAKVKQEYEIEAADERELDELMGEEMNPASVVELTDFDYDIDSVEGEEDDA